MEPIKLPGSNRVYGENQTGYKPLPALALNDTQGTVITCWKLSEEELENFKGFVFLSQATFNQNLQPVNLAVSLQQLVEIPSAKEFFKLQATRFAQELKNHPVLKFANIGEKEIELMAAFGLEMAKPDFSEAIADVKLGLLNGLDE